MMVNIHLLKCDCGCHRVLWPKGAAVRAVSAHEGRVALHFEWDERERGTQVRTFRIVRGNTPFTDGTYLGRVYGLAQECLYVYEL